MKNYKLNTYANAYGLWRCKITYPIPLGNTGEASTIIYNSTRAAMRAIRRELVKRQALPVKRLKYKIVTGGQTSANRFFYLTVGEA